MKGFKKMKKSLLTVLAALIAFSGSVFAAPLLPATNLAVGFAGATGANTRVYWNFGSWDLITGVDAQVANNGESDYALKLGVNPDLPLVGKYEYALKIARTSSTSSMIDFKDFTIVKNFEQKLTDKINVGVAVQVVRVGLTSADRKIDLFNSIYPYISTTVQF
ncbi:MAG: hypothetical protein AB7F28_02465 [Candidatus Margulisiibacteriota bacterium]